MIRIRGENCTTNPATGKDWSFDTCPPVGLRAVRKTRLMTAANHFPKPLRSSSCLYLAGDGWDPAQGVRSVPISACAHPDRFRLSVFTIACSPSLCRTVPHPGARARLNPWNPSRDPRREAPAPIRLEKSRTSELPGRRAACSCRTRRHSPRRSSCAYAVSTGRPRKKTFTITVQSTVR